MPFVDRLHHRNHNNCSTGFDLNKYEFLKAVNSQAAEENNSELAKLKRHSAFMTIENFLLYLRVWKIEKNREKNTKISSRLLTDAEFRAQTRRFLSGCKQLASDQCELGI